MPNCISSSPHQLRQPIIWVPRGITQHALQLAQLLLDRPFLVQGCLVVHEAIYVRRSVPEMELEVVEREPFLEVYAFELRRAEAHHLERPVVEHKLHLSDPRAVRAAVDAES